MKPNYHVGESDRYYGYILGKVIDVYGSQDEIAMAGYKPGQKFE